MSIGIMAISTSSSINVNPIRAEGADDGPLRGWEGGGDWYVPDGTCQEKNFMFSTATLIGSSFFELARVSGGSGQLRSRERSSLPCLGRHKDQTELDLRIKRLFSI